MFAELPWSSFGLPQPQFRHMAGSLRASPVAADHAIAPAAPT
jgi:hypothetical protein